MGSIRRKHRIRAALATASIIGMAGCITYDIETTLHGDGSGHRSVTVTVEDPHRLDEDLTQADFLAIMSLTKEQGWASELKIETKGDSTYLFRRETDISDPGSWPDLDSHIHILGAAPSFADSTLGNLRLGKVHFRNKVEVSRREGSEGELFTFRETYFWEHGLEALTEALVKGTDDWIAKGYSRLSESDRAEIRGVVRTTFSLGFRDGLLDRIDEDEEAAWGEVLDQITSVAFNTIRAKHPDATREAVRERFDIFSDENGEAVLDELDRLLRGLSVGGDAQITLRLTMPGTVTSTNAHERDGNTLVWVFQPWDALTADVVLVAESAIVG
ncbi:MAG: hypothetical protein PVJ76_05045 [Gemmatimonadota bacterium]|jgi:hypothetical protein